MKHYFSLQYRLTLRYLSDNGANPLLFGVFVAIAFTVLSQYILLKSSFAIYGYAIIPVVLCFSLTGYARNTFLQLSFSKRRYYGIRMVENVLIGLPFIIMLLANRYWLAALLIPVVSSLVLLVNYSPKFNFVLPTPFFKYPFEFLVGVRKSFGWLLIMYLLCGIAIWVGNFNLAAFTLIVLHLTCLTYYGDPENYFYVWIYARNSTTFLLGKIKIMIIYTTVLTLPVLIALSFTFTDKLTTVMLIQLMGYISILAALLGKYAYFPKKIPFPTAFMFVASLILVPLVIIFIPYFYLKSQRALKHWLK